MGSHYNVTPAFSAIFCGSTIIYIKSQRFLITSHVCEYRLHGVLSSYSLCIPACPGLYRKSVKDVIFLHIRLGFLPFPPVL